MSIDLSTLTRAVADPSTSPAPVVEDEEFYSSWSLFLVCMLLILSLWTSYYLQIKRIRAIHETLVSIFAGMAVGLIVRLAPNPMIREMLVSGIETAGVCGWWTLFWSFCTLSMKPLGMLSPNFVLDWSDLFILRRLSSTPYFSTCCFRQ